MPQAATIHEHHSNMDTVKFVTYIEGDQEVEEGEPAHFEVTVAPANDNSIQVIWFKDEQPLTAGSRFNTSYYRGQATLDILYTIEEDRGHYACLVKSDHFGSAESNSVSLNVLCEVSNYGDETAKLQQGCHSLPNVGHVEEKPSCTAPPQFLSHLPESLELDEGRDLHVILLVEPAKDATLGVEWFKDGQALAASCRVDWSHNKGVCELHIAGCIAEDAGQYFCVARNALQEVSSNALQLKVIEGARIVTASNMPEDSNGYRWLKEMETPDSQFDGIDYRSRDEEFSPSEPQFEVKPISFTACEGGPAKFLVRVTGHPQPIIQWFLNEEPVQEDYNYNVTNDGGISCFTVNRCNNLGQAKVTVIASNASGQCHSEADFVVLALEDFRPDLHHVKPENPYKKLQTLRRVEVSPELSKKLRQPKPAAETWQMMERETTIRNSLYKSAEVEQTEKLYDEVAARLKKREPKLQAQ